MVKTDGLVHLDGVYVEDQHLDTLVYCEHLEAKVSYLNLARKVIWLDKIHMDNALVDMKRYQDEDDLNFKFLIDHFRKDTMPSETTLIFSVHKINLTEVDFRFNDYNKARKDTGMDYAHLNVRDIDLDLRYTCNDVDTIEGEIYNLSCKESCGLQLDSLKGYAMISPAYVKLFDMKLKTPKTDISGELAMSYDRYGDFLNFIEKVKMNVKLKDSKVEMADVAYFAPNLWGMEKDMAISGNVRGTVDNLKCRNIYLETREHTVFEGAIDMDGLPNINETFIFLEVKRFETSAQKLEKIPVPPFTEKKTLALNKSLYTLGNIDVRGKFTGFINDFVAYGKLNTAVGQLTTDLSIKRDSTGEFKAYSGYLAANSFDVGKLVDMRGTLGKVTGQLNVKGNGLDPATMHLEADGNLAAVDIKGYNYKDVKLEGVLSRQVFKGDVAVKDQNIDFDFSGSIDMSGKVPHYNFVTNIYEARPVELKLMEPKGLDTRFSTTVYINMKGKTIDDLVGTVKMEESFYRDKISQFTVDELILTSTYDKNTKERRINLTSEVLDFAMDGIFTFSDLPRSFNYILSKHVPSFRDLEIKDIPEENFRFNLSVNNTGLITKLLTPGIVWSELTAFSGSYNARDAFFSLNGSMPVLDIDGTMVYDCNVEAKALDDAFYFNVGSYQWNITDSLDLKNFNINATLINDTLNTNINWDNGSEKYRKGDINLYTAFSPDFSLTGWIRDSYLDYGEKHWVFNNANVVYADTTCITIKGMSVASDTARIYINGDLSRDIRDTLFLEVREYHLEDLTGLLNNAIRPEGILNATVFLSDPFDQKRITGSLTVNDMVINESKLGNGRFLAGWLTDAKMLTMNGNFNLHNQDIINVSGKFMPKQEGDSLDYVFAFSDMPINVISPFVDQYVSETQGSITGYLKLEGLVSEPKMSGQIGLKDIEAHVKYLNTTYKLHSGKIHVDEDMFYMDNATIYDEEDNIAYCNATIAHENFEDFNLNIGLFTNEFLFLNTNEDNNPDYYGKAVLSGSVDVGGYADQLDFMAEVKTLKGTVFNIPLENGEDIGENSLVTFINNKTQQQEEEIDLSNIDMNFSFDITNDAQLRLIFDEKIGDVLKVRGHSEDLKMEVSTNGKFRMLGKYIVEEGDYLFTLSNVINKKFDVEKGGTIEWGGDPYKAQIDVSAIYKLRASPYDLMVGMDSLQREPYRKRQPVWCYLRMQNELLNPDISFNIKMPTADQYVNDRLNGLLFVNESESNVQEMNKQIFALLILNRFLPPQGGNNNDNIARSGFGSTTSSELLSNQLSNWLSQISDEFDVGFNYRPGDDITNDEVELALSTQILNDRVVLDGNVGYSEDRMTSSSNVVGEFSVEYKITEDGRFRAKAFNQANSNAYLGNQGRYTQGAGVYYQQDFDTFKELFKKFFAIFRKKNKKQNKKEEGEKENTSPPKQ